ncbi:Aste57867_14443 [Aphanomyces stellatus]|uniref:Aste57867_14443 protein n=1 Tax=Aphanomyces stellatus TaxID=120398 RepID=A0A485L1S0_9STRA|nr:hypothetical protein As57867_014389 [Aphanomyces stellatus]VFT91265.1 Aste57867_14443 [Aphanomyces stellatus]
MKSSLTFLVCTALLVVGQNATTGAPTPNTTLQTTGPPVPPTSETTTPKVTTAEPTTTAPPTTAPSPPTTTPAPPTTTPSPPTTTPSPPTTTPSPPTTTPAPPTTTPTPATTTPAPATTTATPTTTAPITTTVKPTTTATPTTTAKATTSQPPAPTTTEAPTTTSTTTAAPTATPTEKQNISPTPPLSEGQSMDSKSTTLWIILGSVAGVLGAGILFFALIRHRSRKDEGHDDDVISPHYATTVGGGGFASSPKMSFYSASHPNVKLSFDQRSIPAIVSPAPFNRSVPALSVASDPAFTQNHQFENESDFHGIDMPPRDDSFGQSRGSYPSTTEPERRLTMEDEEFPPTQNLWQSAMTSNAAAQSVNADDFHSTLSDSYVQSLDDPSTEESESIPSDSFISKYSESYAASTRDPYSI